TGAVRGSSPFVTNGTVAEATVGSLRDNIAYHWRAHAVDQLGRTGPWASFGSNLETATDFRVAVAPTQLVFIQPPGTTPAGAAITPPVQVAAQDALGTTLTSFSGSLTVALAAKPGGTAVPVKPSVIVKDAKGNPVAGVAVTFAVTPANGSITGASQTTNASGIATVGSWTLATAAREDTLTATAGVLAGSPVKFTATGTAGDAGSIAVNG